ncbi:hypothetical protein P692DRAFT_201909525, partial [Suillus brevipes Sb2]
MLGLNLVDTISMKKRALARSTGSAGTILEDGYKSPMNSTRIPIPKFHASTKVAILLIMTHAQYESVQLWREQIDESHFDNVDCASATGDNEFLKSQRLKKPRSPSLPSPSTSRVHKRVRQHQENMGGLIVPFST